MRVQTKGETACEGFGFPGKRSYRLFHSNERGSALVEMALSLPIMMVMLTGIFSFSVAFYQKLQLAEAVSAGGRVLALERGNNDPCADTAAAIYAAAPALSKTSMGLTITLGGTNTSGTITGGTGYGASCTAAGSGGASPLVAGWPAQIHATYPCSLGIYGLKLGSCSMDSYVAETIE